MNKFEPQISELCLLCGEFMGNFTNSTRELTNFSRMTVKALLETFLPLNLNNIPQNSSNDSKICQNCFIKLNELDEHQMIAEKIKSDFIKVFSQLYNGQNYLESFPHNYGSHQNHLGSHPSHQLNFIPFQEMKIKVEPDFDLHNNDSSGFPELWDETSEEQKDPEKKVKKRAPRKPKDPNFNGEKNKTPKTPKDPNRYGRGNPKPMDESIEIKTMDKKAVFECKICHKVMKNRSHAREHAAIHKDERNFCCPECGKTFKLESNLRDHQKRHLGLLNKKIICDLCGQRFEKLFYLRQHIEATHLRLEKYTCNICGMTFARKSCFRGHAAVHQDQTQLKKHVCEQCGFRARTKYHLTRHSRTHTEERNFPCNICNKMFANSYNVIAHVNSVHKGIRPKVDESKLGCMLCGKKFPRYKQLRRHLFEVHQVMEHAAEFGGGNNETDVRLAGFVREHNEFLKGNFGVGANQI